MWDWFNCKNDKEPTADPHEYSKHISAQLIRLARTSQAKHVCIVEDKHMSASRQKILNGFKQGHLLERYDRMTPSEQDSFVKQLEMIEFDLIDLVDYLGLTRRTSTIWSRRKKPESSIHSTTQTKRP